MPRKPSYKDLEEMYNRQREELHNHWIAVSLILAEEPDAKEVQRIDVGERYEFRLYGAKRANGGIVVVTQKYRGQRDSSHVYGFLDYEQAVRKQPYSDVTTPTKLAMERLMVAWRQLNGLC